MYAQRSTLRRLFSGSLYLGDLLGHDGRVVLADLLRAKSLVIESTGVLVRVTMYGAKHSSTPTNEASESNFLLAAETLVLLLLGVLGSALPLLRLLGDHDSMLARASTPPKAPAAAPAAAKEEVEPSSIERLAILPGVGARLAGMLVGGACFFLTTSLKHTEHRPSFPAAL